MECIKHILGSCQSYCNSDINGCIEKRLAVGNDVRVANCGVLGGATRKNACSEGFPSVHTCELRPEGPITYKDVRDSDSIGLGHDDSFFTER